MIFELFKSNFALIKHNDQVFFVIDSLNNKISTGLEAYNKYPPFYALKF
ncbi:Uncharacterized protein dnm_046820 [Desulfonema magnum]|uniref:Uncharacterized protein n=1 Tax=Desulfonema magnum TaxID=45655 RepID=A0A975GPB7_9BACT|nr:Uncharacterized protein dnm_046820 [Desulfonema magnum]